MTQNFNHGYALVIGVDDNAVPWLSLPDITKDVNALTGVLQHPERCGYVEENVKIIQGKDATRNGILGGLTWLHEKVTADPEATAIIYYSGHGHEDDTASPADYYLLPYDTINDQFEMSGLRATDFSRAIERIQPKRLLVLLDCCHAQGIGVKGIMKGAAAPAAPQSSVKSTAVPVELFLGGAPAKGPGISKGVEELIDGSGRVVLNSSTGAESSYMRDDGAMSIFTYHLIEALTGHAQPKEGARKVLTSDVASHIYRTVADSAHTMWNREQTPQMQMTGIFPVAMLLGGKGVTKGTTPPDPLQPMPASIHIENSGSGAVAHGDGAVAAGERGVAIGGAVSGSTIMTGDGNTVRNVETGGGNYTEKQNTTFDQRGQSVGKQTNVAGDATIQGDQTSDDSIDVTIGDGNSGITIGKDIQQTGTSIGHQEVNTEGGDHVQRDKIVQGDEVRGDKVGGDKVAGSKYEIGEISGSSAAIGDGASTTVNQGATPAKGSFCTQCGTKLAEDAQFCSNCGHKVSEVG